MTYYDKYLKYRKKYLDAKNVQKGGDNFKLKIAEMSKSDFARITPTNINALAQNFKYVLNDLNNRGEIDLNNPEHVKIMEDLGYKLANLKEDLKNDFLRIISTIPMNPKTGIDGDALIRALEQYEPPSKPKRACTVDEFMGLSHTEVEEKCENLTKVAGSCGFPSFMFSIKEADIGPGERDLLLQLFRVISDKIKKSDVKPSKILIDVGVTSEPNPGIGNRYLVLRFSMQRGYEDIEVVINKILKSSDLEGKTFLVKNFFPLDHTKLNKGIVIEYIKNMMKDVPIPIRIHNKLCGTCFRSFYYLVKHGAEYKMDAAQGRLLPMDREEILNCFHEKAAAASSTGAAAAAATPAAAAAIGPAGA